MSYTGPATGSPDPMVLSTPQIPELTNSGHAVGQVAASTAWNAPTAGSIYLPVRLSQPHTYVTAFWINGATVAGNVAVGIYTKSGTTLTKIAASTAVAQATISVVQIPAVFPSTTIGPGLYYLAITSSLSTATFWNIGVSAATQTRQAGMFQSTSDLTAATNTAAIASFSRIPTFGFSELAIV